MMYPLLLKPPIRSYLWGGSRLKEEYGLESENEKIAEAWLLSEKNDSCGIVLNGEYGGKSFSDVLSLWGAEALGKNCARFDEFPLLIKLIDANKSLSVQVHPDDAYAKKHGGSGKTEMWYVIDCEDGANLIYGFKKNISREELCERIENETLLEVCNTVPVHRGDVFFIPAGTLHAIGSGILIAEVQQNSDTTYRVYDYGRVDANGRTRELHIDKALDVTELCEPTLPYGAIGKIRKYDYGTVRELAQCEFFNVELLKLDGTAEMKNDDSFLSVAVLSGEIDVGWNGGELKVTKGASIFVPAKINITLSGNGELLCSRV